MPSPTPTHLAEESLDIVATRLIGCMAAMVTSFREHGVSVETRSAFFLDITSCCFPVPHTLDGIPVQMNFVGSVPPWADRVRYHLQVYFVGERRWSAVEPPNGFNVPLLVARILKQLDGRKQAAAALEQAARDKARAEQQISNLSASLDLAQTAGLCLQQDNLKIEGLPEVPDEVLITVRTSLANAEAIAREFRASRKRQRKP